MLGLYFVLACVALVCFAVAALGRSFRDVNLVAAGLFFTTLIVMLQLGDRVF